MGIHSCDDPHLISAIRGKLSCVSHFLLPEISELLLPIIVYFRGVRNFVSTL